MRKPKGPSLHPRQAGTTLHAYGWRWQKFLEPFRKRVRILEPITKQGDKVRTDATLPRGLVQYDGARAGSSGGLVHSPWSAQPAIAYGYCAGTSHPDIPVPTFLCPTHYALLRALSKPGPGPLLITHLPTTFPVSLRRGSKHVFLGFNVYCIPVPPPAHIDDYVLDPGMEPLNDNRPCLLSRWRRHLSSRA
ncbi:uncharacterized protein BDZ83DRAFT_649691 [Colletotrichum acutatum]|uniref:Uncharacterized protein n=1 Tax=Glomerella acutata TaxID=27357 RepID=A0AAD8UW29_GLOAC|nr:uncharacterized protein BDZ83DRAFT_649691 [Colletotrichum acutatum]KAK1727345.1 hypothetical protein BDZ83DRAFT_649691 [Colletotrichum acutatum]